MHTLLLHCFCSIRHLFFGMAADFYDAVCYILGAVTLAWGLVKISGFVKNKDKNKSFSFQFSLIIGIFLTIAGALLIVFPRFILPVIPIIMGIMLTADGIHKLRWVLTLKQLDTVSGG